MELKNFFEVFTQFENNTEVKDIFRDVMVKRIVNNRSRNIIRIYIECNRLIHKDDIYKVENELVKIFRGKVQVKIIESFNLSKQYNSENLFEMYKDSIIKEIYNYSPLEYSILKKSEISFKEDIMFIKIADNVISNDKSSELKRILEKIFNERCGVPTEIRYDFVEMKESKYEKISQLKIEQEVEAIIANVNKNLKSKEDKFEKTEEKSENSKEKVSQSKPVNDNKKTEDR